MAEAIARARTLRIAPRKARLVADLIRGKRVVDARAILQYTGKKAAPLWRKVLESAVANAEHAAQEEGVRIDPDEMVVTKIFVDEGFTIKRYVSAPRGRATPIRKRTSHFTLVIADNEN